MRAEEVMPVLTRTLCTQVHVMEDASVCCECVICGDTSGNVCQNIYFIVTLV